jgi:hypothetical protein
MQRMVKVSVEVRSGSARFRVSVQANSMSRKFEHHTAGFVR